MAELIGITMEFFCGEYRWDVAICAAHTEVERKKRSVVVLEEPATFRVIDAESDADGGIEVVVNDFVVPARFVRIVVEALFLAAGDTCEVF